EGLRVIGRDQYPNATPASMQSLMTGMVDSQWMELNGVVRSVTVVSNRTMVAVSTGDAIMDMTVMGDDHAVPSHFVGASIEARGVCRTLFDTRRRLQGIAICVPGWDQLEIKEAEAADPFQLPPRPINALFEFHAGGYGLNRSHVRGRIILRERNGAFYMQDESGGILVDAGGAVPETDLVDVVGFPALKDQLPVLQDTLARPVMQAAATVAPPANPLSPESALDEGLNATLVTLDGRVLTHSFSTTEETVTVQFGQRLIDAIMERPSRDPLPPFVASSTVRFTGVYVARLDNNRQIQSFQILLRSPADAVVISVPPWWTAQHALYVFGGLGGVLLVALAWVAGLREQVRRRTRQLRAEIEERKRIEAQMEKTHREMIEISRKAGMAEVATNVLHNVGNVLNSVNVSATLLFDNARNSIVSRLSKAVALLNEHATDAGDYLANDPKGKQLPEYLSKVCEQLAREQQLTIGELESLRQHIEHIMEIVAAQQSYAKISGVAETVKLTEVVEDALRMSGGDLAWQDVKLVRDYREVPEISVEKHKLLQILVNLMKNAKCALDDSGRTTGKQITLSIRPVNGSRVGIEVVDNGVGIAAENLQRIFAHGFTTRKNGHGFGLHSGALAAKELEGSLRAQSAGPGQGASFVLELPAGSPEKAK
ncbi:MAG TPA: ATP-binding protein, partial [Candidatus Angelobacter sp.]|nr:ATP-binding protein [Candidatus Angelobacter sp.]